MNIIQVKEELNTGKLRHFNVNYCFKFNEWAGFEIGYGEFFRDDKTSLKNDTNADFFFKTVEVSEKIFQTTIIPNEKLNQDKSNWQDMDMVKICSIARTYETNFSNLETFLTVSRKIGIWELYEDYTHFIDIEMDNFLWYYLGACQCGKLTIETEIQKHPLYKELCELENN